MLFRSDRDAIVNSAYPAVGITAPTMRTIPDASAGPVYDGVWQANVSLWDRGIDHEDTQSRIQRWAKALRIAVLIGKSLGVATGPIRWMGESYGLVGDRGSARTLAGCEVYFELDVEKAIDVNAVADFIAGQQYFLTQVTTPLMVNPQ